MIFLIWKQVKRALRGVRLPPRACSFAFFNLCFALSLGCGSNADPGGAGAGASTGGSAGLGGAGGATSSGGTTASAGTAGAGVAGTMAMAGSGGTTSGGAGGTSGAGGGGTAGAGGGGEVTKSAGCGKARTLENGTVTVQSGGVDRTYILRIPDDYDNAHPYRLILGFHGATGNGSQVAPSYFGLWELAEGSTIFIAPDAVGGFWSADDDLVLIDDILAQVEADLCIDTDRIALEGFSMGGAMVWTAACARPDRFSAAVVHSGGGLPVPEICEPVPFMSSLGAQESGGARQTSNSDTFAENNGCTVESLPQAPSGGHACTNYEGCTPGYPVRWCDYDGGHTPSPNDQGQDSSWMPEEVWSFLSQF